MVYDQGKACICGHLSLCALGLRGDFRGVRVERSIPSRAGNSICRYTDGISDCLSEGVMREC